MREGGEGEERRKERKKLKSKRREGKEKRRKRKRKEKRRRPLKKAFSALTAVGSIHYIPCVFLMVCLLPAWTDCWHIKSCSGDQQV